MQNVVITQFQYVRSSRNWAQKLDFFDDLEKKKEKNRTSEPRFSITLHVRTKLCLSLDSIFIIESEYGHN